MNDDPRNLTRLLEADVRPRTPGVRRFVHAVAVRWHL